MRSVEKPDHILRNWGSNMELLAGDRVAQVDSVGVEGRPGDKLLVLRAVEPVPGQGMADGGHVEPQLVGAAGLGHQTE